MPVGELGRRPLLWVCLLYAGLTVLLTYPLPFQLTDHVLEGGSDPELWMWTLSWATHAFVHQPFAIFDANIFYPLRHTLAYSESLVGSALFAAPVLWATGNPVLALNGIEVLSVFLSALGGYVLGRRTGLRPTSAFIVGLVFGFSPARFLRIDQFHLTTIQWIPFSLAFLHAYLDGGRRWHLRLAVAFFTLQALTSGHGAVFLTVAVLVLLGYRLMTGDRLAPVRRMADLGVIGALLLLPAVAAYLPYRAARADVPSLARTADPGPNFASYFASSSHVHRAMLAHVPAWVTKPEADAELFPGIVPLVLSAVALAWPRRQRRHDSRSRRVWTRVGVILEMMAVVLVAVGIYLSVTGETRVRISGTTVASVRNVWRLWGLMIAIAALRVGLARWGLAPARLRERLAAPIEGFRRWWDAPFARLALCYALVAALTLWLMIGPPLGLWQFVYRLPGFSFIRVSSRLAVLTTLALAVLAGIGFERLVARRRAAGRLVAAGLIAAAFVAEAAAFPLWTEPYRLDIPAIDRWLATRPTPFVVAEVPMPRTTDVARIADANARYMLHSMAHWQKTVHGFSGAEPRLHTALFDELKRFPDDDSLTRLTSLGVTYVVMHRDAYVGDELEKADEGLRRYAAWLTLEHAEGDGRVYRLHRPGSLLPR